MVKATLMLPDSDLDPGLGLRFEQIAHFSARRARTLKTHDALWDEVMNSTPEKRASFLRAVLQEEWSLDVAEMNIFIFDVEEIPSWLMLELLRHRFIAREWSFEQRSKRAIQGHRIPTINPFDPAMEYDLWEEFEDLSQRSNDLMIRAHQAGMPAQKIRYACLEGTETALVAAGNARALHHVFTLRGSAEIDGDGRASPEFMELANAMYREVQEVCPQLFERLLRS